MTLDDFLVDKRTVERHLKEGRLSAADHQRMLAELPDRSDNVQRAPRIPAQEPRAQPAAEAAVEARASAPRPEPGLALDASPA